MAQSLPVTSLSLRCEYCGQRYPVESNHECAQAPPREPSEFGGKSRPAMPPSLLGAILGERYEILSEISTGGMGVVYKAKHLALKNFVAVKILRSGPQVPGAKRRFLLEARLLSRLKHPNIVGVIDFGMLPDGRNFLVMEFLQGTTLGSLLKGGRLEPKRACQIALQMVRGLHMVHAQGIVHRDMKLAALPSEIT